MSAKGTKTADKPAEIHQSAEDANKEVVAASEKATPASAETEGKRARKAFMMKQFLPNKDWINVNVVAKGEGTKVIIGRVYGACFGWEEKTHTFPDGKTSTSVALKGAFEAESYMTGELDSATQVYLPAAYAERVKAVFQSVPDLKVVEIDCDIGLAATGKAIPYEWVVVAYREGEEMAVLTRIKGSRQRPANAVALAAPKAAALTDQSK